MENSFPRPRFIAQQKANTAKHNYDNRKIDQYQLQRHLREIVQHCTE